MISRKAHEMKIVIDNREKRIIEYFEQKQNEFAIQALDIGDIQCVCEETNTPLLIIERKSLKDLAASIKDGRYKEQKLRLMSSSTPFIYLIEGTFTDTRKHARIQNMSVKTLMSALTNMIIRDKIRILRTTSLHHTLCWLDLIFEKARTKPELFTQGEKEITEDHIVRSIIRPKKKQNMNAKMCAIAQLAQIPGVSHTTAQGIVDLYGSLHGLFIVYSSKETDEDKRNLLCNKTYTNRKGHIKMFGPNLSNQVYTFMYGLQ